MINSIKGDVSFTVGEQAYVLRLDVNALIALEDETGITAPQLSGFLREGMPLKILRTIFTVALHEHQPDITEMDAGKLITDIGGPSAAILKMAEAVTAAWPSAVPAQEGEGDATGPSKRRPKGGTGSATTADGSSTAESPTPSGDKLRAS